MQEDTHYQTQTAGGKGGNTQSVTQVSYTYRITFAALICAGPVWALRRIWANKKVIWDNGSFNQMFAVRFYTGDGSQTPDPAIETNKGVGNAPAYRHSCYIVVENLQLADFGNVLPQIEVEIHPTPFGETVGAVVQDICAQADIANVSVAGLGSAVRGYIISRDSSCLDAIQPLALAFNFDAAEQRGEVRFVLRGGAMQGVVPIDDMGVAQADAERPETPFEITLGVQYVMPKAVTLSYADLDFAYQQGSQTAERSRGNAKNNLTQAVPLVMVADEARAVVDRLMREAWAARRNISFPVSDRWIHLSPADLIGVNVLGEVVPFKITRGTRGNDGVIEVEGRFEDPEIYSSVTPGQPPILPPQAFTPVGNTVLFLINGPLFIEANDDSGYYWALNGASHGWRGASILRSVDGGGSYSAVVAQNLRAITGAVASALPDGPVSYFDEANSVTVQLHYDRHSFESKTQEAVLAGENTFWLGPASGNGGEVISFRQAALISGSTWRLSGLLRGRRGTDYATATHGLNEVLVMLNTATVGHLDYGAGDWNRTRVFKPVSVLQNEVDAIPQNFAATGEAKRPFSPVHVTGSRDGSNNLTINWIRRTRLPTAGLGGGPAPLGEETEAYEVDVMAGAIVKRTISVASPTASYAAAQQLSDGFTPGNPITVDTYQLSAVRGRGHPRRAVV
jgi:hypothetical protein